MSSSCAAVESSEVDTDNNDDDYVHVDSNAANPQAYTNEKEGFDVQEKFMKSFRPWHLLDPRRPWVLVPNGSFGGYFDWVPSKFRIGPWSTVAKVYWMVLWYVAILGGCYFYNQETESLQELSISDAALLKSYPAAWSSRWWYHAIGCAWMVCIIFMILVCSPAGYRAWSTFTVISWTLLTIRHGLCTALPWYPSLLNAVEWLRFPCAMYHTVVFSVWNFVLVPFLLKVVMKDDPEKQRNFFKFCVSFRLFNLHVVNIVLCILHIYWASPPRRLTYVDLYAACVGILLYMTFYLFVLDRLGVHLYPVFTPRVGKLVLGSWSGSIVLYFATFYGWRHLLQPE